MKPLVENVIPGVEKSPLISKMFCDFRSSRIPFFPIHSLLAPYCLQITTTAVFSHFFTVTFHWMEKRGDIFGMHTSTDERSQSSSKTQLSKPSISGSFSKLSTKKTRSSDSFHKSVLKRSEHVLWVEVQRHDGMQARCS